MVNIMHEISKIQNLLSLADIAQFTAPRPLGL
jgi:hypothetical protein